MVDIPLPPALESDFVNEARRRGIDARAYTRFVMERLADAFATHSPTDEHQVLSILSRLESELPRAWRIADDHKRLRNALLVLTCWFMGSPERLPRLTTALTAAMTPA